jgi:3-hexulose-6-phosphate synthase
MLDRRVRYLQLAFNDDARTAVAIARTLPRDGRILLEAGTPYIKLEGMSGVRQLRSVWPDGLVADLKTSDGGAEELAMVAAAGATAATVMGSCPTETLDRFIQACAERGLDSMVDMLGVADPLHTLRHLRRPPDVVVLHRGRDEESSRGKVIAYKHVTRIRSKYDVAISAAGGVDLKEARSAIFNGANIVVVNVVAPGTPWEGIPSDGDVAGIARQFLNTIA